MGFFSKLFGSNKNEENSNESNVNEGNTIDYIKPLETPKSEIIEETSYSITHKEEHSIFEYVRFTVAGTYYYQENILKELEKGLNSEEFYYFDEKYDGMTNREILEDTFDEPVFEYQSIIFSVSDCSMVIEEDNEYDDEAIAIYINDSKVGHVPRKNYTEGKAYIYKNLLGKVNEKSTLMLSLILGGGKYKVNRDDEVIEKGESSYKLDAEFIIRTPRE